MKRIYILPFTPKIRMVGEEIGLELLQAIEKEAKKLKKHPHNFSAKFEMRPIPKGKNHYFISEVVLKINPYA